MNDYGIDRDGHSDDIDTAHAPGLLPLGLFLGAVVIVLVWLTQSAAGQALLARMDGM